MRKLIQIFSVALAFIAFFQFFAAPTFAADPTACSWNAANGKLTYCAGLKYKSDFERAFVVFSVPGVQGSQQVNLKGYTVPDQPGADGLYYTCFSGDFDDDVLKKMKEAISYQCGVETTLDKLGFTFLSDVFYSTANAGLTSKAEETRTRVCLEGLNGQNMMSIIGQLHNPADPSYPFPGAGYCEAKSNIYIGAISLNNQGKFTPGDLDPNLEPYRLCERIGDAALRSKCLECASKSGGDDGTKITGIWTGIGCVPTNEVSLIQTLVRAGLGISGGIALLMALGGSALISFSQGEQKRVTEGRELLTSAAFGLLFIIFSVAILQFIGVKVLQIPGFGEAASGIL